MSWLHGALGNRRPLKRLLLALCGAATALFLLDLFVNRHADQPWAALYGVFGLAAFGALLLFACEVRRALMRSEQNHRR